MLHCPNCGTNNTQETKFCTNCGQKLYLITEEDIFKQKTPPIAIPKTKQKRNNNFGVIGKVLIGIVILFAIWVIWLLASDTNTHKQSNKISTTEIVNEEKTITNETNSSNTEKIKEIAPKINNKTSAIKYQHGIGVQPNQYKAFELYKKLAAQGDLDAMVELSSYYEQGIWTKKDSKKARQLLQKAANKGSLAAKWQLEFLESER